MPPSSAASTACPVSAPWAWPCRRWRTATWSRWTGGPARSRCCGGRDVAQAYRTTFHVPERRQRGTGQVVMLGPCRSYRAGPGAGDRRHRARPADPPGPTHGRLALPRSRQQRTAGRVHGRKCRRETRAPSTRGAVHEDVEGEFHEWQSVRCTVRATRLYTRGCAQRAGRCRSGRGGDESVGTTPRDDLPAVTGGPRTRLPGTSRRPTATIECIAPSTRHEPAWTPRPAGRGVGPARARRRGSANGPGARLLPFELCRLRVDEAQLRRDRPADEVGDPVGGHPEPVPGRGQGVEVIALGDDLRHGTGERKA